MYRGTEDFLVKNNFSVRPTASSGLWIFLLLPFSLIVSLIRYPVIVTPTYKLASIVSFTFLCNSLYIVVKYYKKEQLKILNVWSVSTAIVNGCLINICLHKEWIFSLLTGVLGTFVSLKIYTFLLTKLKESFTLGEAGLISQGITIFLICSLYNICSLSTGLKNNIQISTLIIQVGLLGIVALAYVVFKLDIRTTKSFYITAFIIVTLAIIIPLHILLNQSPLLWIFEQVFQDVLLLKLFVYWSACIVVAVLAISNQIYYARKASTSTRKIFHVLAVLVYIPGLYFRCCFLYMATGVVLGVFFLLEILRVLSLPPLGKHLQDGYVVFKDDKDTGLLALTPIYLLAGVSLPIWVHPSPCDVMDSAQFTLLPLLSGLVSIGIGDTAASYIGSKYGTFKWPNSSKTIEGTIACIVSQLGFFYFLYYIGILSYLTPESILRILISVVVGSVLEAKTTQIDNLVLPLVMYIILI